MKERPILFNAPMVRAILEGRKTMTRRVVKPQIEEFKQHTPDKHSPKHPKPYLDAYCGEPKTSANPRGVSPNWHWWTRDNRPGECVAKCHYGQPGDRLWVRETAQRCPVCEDWNYAESNQKNCTGCDATLGKWTPSIFMPREACRIRLEITDVRVERLNSISADDAGKEGCGFGVNDETGGPVARFKNLWDSINSKRGLGWDVNPWVWAITFKKL